MTSIFPERNSIEYKNIIQNVPIFLPARTVDRINIKSRHDGSTYVDPMIYRNQLNLNELFSSRPEMGINNLRLKQLEIYNNGINNQIKFNRENLDMNQPNRHGFRQVGIYNRNPFN